MARIYRADESFDLEFFKGTSCAFGVFDGVHRGHRFLLSEAQRTARESGGMSVALTFDRDPDERFHPERLRKLMTNEERIAMLAETGVDAVVVLPFTVEFAASLPNDFLSETFQRTVPAHLHVGSDFHFGVRGSGTVEDLNLWSERLGTKIHAHRLVAEDGAPISATRIRLLLADGKIEEANHLLTRNYFVSGTVEQGRGEGADFGFKTANFVVPEQMRALGDGVYAAYAWVDGVRYKSAVNVGIPATFADRSHAIFEAHLIDFDGDLYGKPLRVEFTNWLRPMRKFDSLDELIATVNSNIAWARENL